MNNPQNNSQPIGIFDSGVGGLSVLQHIHQRLPHEAILYIADSAYAPYGCKDTKIIKQRSKIITEHLIAQGVKAIVIACNTATASVIESFRRQYNIPFVGVEPGIKPAIVATKNGHIGIMATSNTLSSARYHKLSQRFTSKVHLHHQPCPGLADQVEAGLINDPKTIQLLQIYLNKLQQKQVDTIVLGCTHYSFLSQQIKQLSIDSMSIIDTSSAISEQLLYVLTKNNLINHNVHQKKTSIQYFTTGSSRKMQSTLNCLVAPNLSVKKI
ncbi:MAG: glutamate racemase [Gammaproteobacteria bacterium]|nr:glutamate racemase [Gammaproteobacteria bacterium]